MDSYDALDVMQAVAADLGISLDEVIAADVDALFDYDPSQPPLMDPTGKMQ